jgi:O-antigen ligase
MALSPGLASFVWATLTWQSGSSTSHLKDWTAGLMAMREHPLGLGLGTADQTAIRFGLEAVTADNLYLKYAVELGVAGLLMYLAILCGAALAGARLFRGGATASHRMLGACVLAATVGVAINGMTAVLYNQMMLSYLFFWLVGTAVTLAQRSPSLDGRRANRA